MARSWAMDADERASAVRRPARSPARLRISSADFEILSPLKRTSISGHGRRARPAETDRLVGLLSDRRPAIVPDGRTVDTGDPDGWRELCGALGAAGRPAGNR